MQVVNRLIPIRDRAAVQLNLDRLNAIFEGDPLNQLDVVPDQGGSGYKLTPAAEQVVFDRVVELLSHRVGMGSPIAPDVWIALAYFKVNLTNLPVQEGVPDVEDIELTPEDAVVEPVKLSSAAHPILRKKQSKK